jgi:hypothetical protein
MSQAQATIVNSNVNFGKENEAVLEATLGAAAAVVGYSAPAIRTLKVLSQGDEIGEDRTKLFKTKLPFQDLQLGLKKIAELLPAPPDSPKIKSDLTLTPELAAETAVALTAVRKLIGDKIGPIIDGLSDGSIQPSVELRQEIEAYRRQAMACNALITFIFDATRPIKPGDVEPEVEETEEPEVAEVVDDDAGI